MSKRRRNKKPNLPEATLRRAREQAKKDSDDASEETSSSDTSEESSSSESQSSSPVERAARRRRLSPVQLERSRERGELDVEVIEDMLANPTDEVTEEELAAEYGHVLTDLRNMAILAVVLMVVMVALAQFI